MKKRIVILISLALIFAIPACFATAQKNKTMLNIDKKVIQAQQMQINQLSNQSVQSRKVRAKLQAQVNQLQTQLVDLGQQLQTTDMENLMLKTAVNQTSFQATVLQQRLASVKKNTQLKAGIYPLLTANLIHQSHQLVNCIRNACYIAPSIELAQLNKMVVSQASIEALWQAQQFTPTVFVLMVILLLLLILIVGSLYNLYAAVARKRTLDYEIISGEDVCATKLDSAHAYIGMQDYKMAKRILHDVLRKGTAEQKAEAKKLLSEIKNANSARS